MPKKKNSPSQNLSDSKLLQEGELQQRGSSHRQVEASNEPDHRHYAGIRPEKTGDTRFGRDVDYKSVNSLGSSEADIMDVIWDFARSATPMDVCEELLYRRRKNNLDPLSFSTVSTILRRLSEKGVLTQPQSAGRTPVYTAAMSRHEMAARILCNVSLKILRVPLFDLLESINMTQGARLKKGTVTYDVQSVAALVDAIEHICGESSPDSATGRTS